MTLDSLISELACFVGLHSWKQDRPVAIIDGWPMDPKHETPERECRRCEKREKWLPGYGGSEWGCWCPSPKKTTSST